MPVIYFQAQNLFTITNYTGADPEGLGYPYALPANILSAYSSVSKINLKY